MVNEEGTENLREVLEEVILAEDAKLSNADEDAKRKSYAYNFTEFYKLKLEEDKLDKDYTLKMRELEQKAEITKIENARKDRELDIREKELEANQKASKLELVKSGVTLAAWAGLSIGVMIFESNGGAILSKAFPGIFPKTKI